MWTPGSDRSGYDSDDVEDELEDEYEANLFELGLFWVAAAA